MTTKQFIATSLSAFEAYLDQHLNHLLSDSRQRLNEAMRYSSLDAGKRFRPLLVLATNRCFSNNIKSVLPLAAAVEAIHCFSLIHDDLPCMDDDDIRRGKASCHKAFDDATAVLAGDALQAFAFELMAEHLPHFFPTDRCLYAIKHLAKSIGTDGLIGGQILDMYPPQNPCIDALKQVHRYKTGALIEAAIMLPAILHQAPTEILDALLTFGRHLGLCFQIRDDILDVESSTKKLGKTTGKDQLQNKLTYVTYLGLKGAKDAFDQEYKAAQQTLVKLTNTDTSILNDLLKMLDIS